MGATLWTLEKDLWDKSIPLFERPWMNTDTEWWRELMSRIRAKRATLVSRAMEEPKALQESHPWEYRQFREDLWIYKDDFDGYTTLFVPRIIEGLKSLRISSWEEFLDRNQWIPYFAAAKFNSAFAVWWSDPDKAEKLYILLYEFQEAWWKSAKVKYDKEWAKFDADDDDDDLF